MKIVFSQEEIEAIEHYAKAKAKISDPCEMCEDNGTCCGCPKEVEYKRRIESKISLLPDPRVLDLPEIKAYISAVANEDLYKEKLDYAKYEYDQAVEKLRNAKDILGIVDSDEN